MRSGVAIGATPISALVLITFSLVVARTASLVLETAKPEVKRRSDRKEGSMNGKLVAGSLLETAWAIGVSVVTSILLPLP
jgi:hypothetical protein